MKRVFSTLSSCMLMLFLGGCALNKAVVYPWSYSPESPENYWSPTKKLNKLAADTTPSQDPELPVKGHTHSLAEILQIALINNTETKKTWARAKEAASQYGQSQSPFLPSIEGSYSFERQRFGTYFSGNSTGTEVIDEQPQNDLFITTYSQWGPQFALTYTLFDFGQRRATSVAAKEALYYADYTHNRSIELLLQTITTDYYNYLYAQMLSKAYLDNVETAQTTLDSAKAGVDAGVKDISDFLQARTQFLQNEIIYVHEKQNVQNTHAKLLSNMGVPSNYGIGVIPMPNETPDEQIFPDTDALVQVALENRPDYLAAKANLRSKDAELSAARKEVLPEVNYDLAFGKTFFQKGLNDKYDYHSTISVKMPIFSGFFYRNNMKLVKAAQEKAKAELQTIELAVIQDIATYRYNITIAYETMKYARDFLASAEEQYNVSLAQYRAGTNTILDLLSSQSALSQARATQAKAIQDWYVNLARLVYSIGITSKTAINEETLSP